MKTITKNQGAPAARANEQDWAPAPLDVYENDKEFLLVADLPGVPQGGADITLEHDRLVLEAKGSTRKYRRELVVPPSVDAEGVSAQMKAGVLTLHLPKRAPYQPRQIPVRAA
jgi:HSP20 family molecular chaperone IbpA